MVAALRETARGIAGADGISVVLREGAFCHYVAEDAVAPLWRGRRFRLEDCISGWTMLNGETAIIADLERDARVPQALYRGCPMRSLVMTPVGSPDPVAAIGAYWCAYVEPDPATIRRLGALAEMAATAMSRLTLRADSGADAVSRTPSPTDTARRAG